MVQPMGIQSNKLWAYISKNNVVKNGFVSP